MSYRATSMLAFNDPWHDSSFCFTENDGLRHVESERFTRRKYECINPMVIFCELFGEQFAAFDTVAIQTNAELARFTRALLTAKRRSAVERTPPPLPFVDRWLAALNPDEGRADTPATRAFVEHLLREDVYLHLCGHHAAHAANAYYSTHFDQALVVTLDGGGRDFAPGLKAVLDEDEYLAEGLERSKMIYGSVYEGRGNTLTLREQLDTSSLGVMWNRVVPELLGMRPGEEGTAMAMAALGDPARFAAELGAEVVRYPEVNELPQERRGEVVRWLEHMRTQVSSDQDRYDVAAALQAVTEKTAREMFGRLLEPHHRNLCLSGGVFLNCQLTGKLRSWFPQLENVYLPPVPYDAGLSLGAIQLVHHVARGREERLFGGAAPFAMGPCYSRDQVLSAISEAGATFTTASPREFVRSLAEGRIAALFQGSSESGRRALGNRSIVAHPGIAGIKERLNQVIKKRAWFRPFAPMVLAERVGEWFDCEVGFSSPYMSFAVPVKAHARGALENVVHLDGTARVQTVDRELTPRMHALLTTWHEESGLPVLLNTSFNDNEPIVETPADAVRTFLRTPIDHLYFADHAILVDKV